MKHWTAKRRFLFLQGPPGPLFRDVGSALAATGHAVHRINLNGGDRHDWPGALDFRGRSRHWPLFIDRYLREHQITDLIMFGDCRPMHMAAHGMAKLRGISIHVLEEGYVRPDWMTFEPDGVNGNSTLRRDPDWLVDEARRLPPVASHEPITATFRRRARDSYWYYHRVVIGRLRFPFYRSHRPGSIILEGLGWLLKFSRARSRSAAAERVLAKLGEAPYFLMPLQLSSDYQIRTHSPFDDMASALEHALSSFALFAPAGTRLVVKEHPLDCGFRNWAKTVARLATRHGVADRVVHLDGGDLERLSRGARGVVCVNSTSGTLALASGTPTIVLGDALYDVARVTHQGPLDSFWAAPQRPDRQVFDAFRRVLHHRCLIRGGLASESATRILTASIIERLFRDPAHAAGAPIDLPMSVSA